MLTVLVLCVCKLTLFSVRAARVCVDADSAGPVCVCVDADYAGSVCVCVSVCVAADCTGPVCVDADCGSCVCG